MNVIECSDPHDRPAVLSKMRRIAFRKTQNGILDGHFTSSSSLPLRGSPARAVNEHLERGQVPVQIEGVESERKTLRAQRRRRIHDMNVQMRRI